MLDALNLHNRFIWRCFQHTVVATCSRMTEIYRTTQGISPELGSLINIRCAAINQERAETRVVHGYLFDLGGGNMRCGT